MKVTEIEVHPITLEYVDWIAYQLNHFYGPITRTVYVVHTDNGLVGLGESGSMEPQEVIDGYIGTNPFDWMGDEISLGLGTAMYDLMGQYAGVPVYKLFGQKYRSWVPVGSWTVSTHPHLMAETVEQYAAQGYTWLKYHLSPFENVMDQTEAMQAVAPEGFKIHYDFTMHGTDDHMPELLAKLEQYPIAGCFEDPLPGEDIEGYIELRKRSRLPIVLHPFSDGCDLRSIDETRRCLHARAFEDRRCHPSRWAICRRQQSLHAPKRRRHYHADDDDTHDGCIPDRNLPLFRRHRNLEGRCRRGTVGAD